MSQHKAMESRKGSDTLTLDGKTILVTRPRNQSQEIQRLLEAKGGNVVFHPVIEILPVEDDLSIRQYVADMEYFCLGEPESADCPVPIGLEYTRYFIQNRDGVDGFDWVLFSSANGVDYFMEYFDKTSPCFVPKKPVRLAAVGPGTAAALRRYKLVPDVVPELHQAEGLVEALKDEAAKGKRFLSVRGSRGRDVLVSELVRLGGRVEEVVVYRSIDVTQPDTIVQNMLNSGQLDVVTATSSAIARSLITLFGEGLRKSRVVTISPLTSQVFRDAGYRVEGEAKTATIASLVECVAAIFC